jgi:type IX secretion system PorP/SprF family membrane protein
MTGANIMLSVRKQTGVNSFFQAGLGIAIVQQTIDWSKFTFPDQYDPNKGYLNTPSSFSHYTDQSTFFPDPSAGLIFKTGNGPKKGLFRKNCDLKIGIAVHHLRSLFSSNPTPSFLGKENDLPLKFIFHANSNIALNRDADLVVSPCVVFECQNPMSTVLLGSNLLWNESFFLGSWFRKSWVNPYETSTLSFTIGFNSKLYKQRKRDFDMLKFYYCYDMTLTGLRNNTTGGSHEFGIAYFFNSTLCNILGIGNSRNKHKKIRRIPCIEFKPASY